MTGHQLPFSDHSTMQPKLFTHSITGLWGLWVTDTVIMDGTEVTGLQNLKDATCSQGKTHDSYTLIFISESVHILKYHYIIWCQQTLYFCLLSFNTFTSYKVCCITGIPNTVNKRKNADHGQIFFKQEKHIFYNKHLKTCIFSQKIGLDIQKFQIILFF